MTKHCRPIQFYRFVTGLNRLFMMKEALCTVKATTWTKATFDLTPIFFFFMSAVVKQHSERDIRKSLYFSTDRKNQARCCLGKWTPENRDSHEELRKSAVNTSFTVCCLFHSFRPPILPHSLTLIKNTICGRGTGASIVKFSLTSPGNKPQFFCN